MNVVSMSIMQVDIEQRFYLSLTKTFADMKTVENDPETGYCYTAIHETADNSILLGYCAGSVADGCCLNRLRIRKIGLNEI